MPGITTRADSAPPPDDVAVRERLAHYQQAAETARSELAALQAKHQSVQSQLLEARARLASREAAVQELREELEGYKETSARQGSVVSSLRERVRDAEQEIGALTSAKSRLDTTMQALTAENQELRGRGLELESQSQEYLNGWNKTKEEASESERRYQEFVFKLAVRMSTDLTGKGDPLDFIASQVESLCQQREGQRGKIRTLEENVEAQEVECRASRETVMRLVAEVGRERGEAATRAKELESLKQEFDRVSLAKRNLEAENQSLQERLQASQRALAASRQELGSLERRSQELDGSLRGSQGEAQALQARQHAFREEVAALLGGPRSTAPPTEDDLRERLRELCSQEKSGRESLLEMEQKLARVSKKLAEQEELHQGALQRAQLAEQQVRELGGQLRGLEVELLSGEVVRDGLRHGRQQFERFLEQLSEKMKLAAVAADLGFDMRLEAILSRAEQLVKQEVAALVESKTLAHSLQRKLKAQKERLESKELHADLLRRKVAQLEEEKRSRSALAVERDDAHLAARKLQKKVERLQEELGSMRLSNTELKAQLAHTNELKIKVMEQSQTITEQSRSLGELEEGKVRAEKRLSTARTELETRGLRSMQEQQRTQSLLDGHASELRTLRHTVDELTKTERQLTDFRRVVSEMLGLDASSLAVPDYEIIKRLEWLLHPYHHYHHHHPHLSPDTPCHRPSQQNPNLSLSQKDHSTGSAPSETPPIAALKALPPASTEAST
ncbi:coiled-coil domain-containing protein 170 [Megalops cyprinoides]|uniref:coiled-coil domain-containing protein 170 n=1 Tax=Megalops cyprinoides TaxID=118141 RepID=UPI0018643483|nr:coiled-coil domain-containing protein 170 [Megalops cyprinoides]